MVSITVAIGHNSGCKLPTRSTTLTNNLFVSLDAISFSNPLRCTLTHEIVIDVCMCVFVCAARALVVRFVFLIEVHSINFNLVLLVLPVGVERFEKMSRAR